MIKEFDKYFVLDTQDTTYIFRCMETGHLEHLYYGKKITVKCAEDAMAIVEKHSFQPGNVVGYDKEHQNFSLEDICLEMSTYGKGDIREPFIELKQSNGSFTSDFLYESHCILKGKKQFYELPGSFGNEDEVETLTIVLRDKISSARLEMNYYVYEECNIISKNVKLVNDSSSSIIINRLLSNQLDFSDKEYIFTTFNGSWAREMNRNDLEVKAGTIVNSSYTGSSSNRSNPFVMLSRKNADENHGECYGFNLIYSGNHFEAVDVNGYGKMRFLSGINHRSFSFIINENEEFETPEAVMTFSEKGFNGMSLNMHHFVKKHIIRKEWQDKVRPVLLNSWEAAYFDINERKLLNLAKAAKDVGVELFVMDDGWFGERDNDTKSLGDWEVNKKKLPSGLKGLCDKVKALDMDFGIWVEPEMVNVDSNLYKEHPEWVIELPAEEDKSFEHSEGRNQRILDLANPEVVEFIIEAMTKVFGSADISYVKWDMNRIFSECYSKYLGKDRQGETFHRYILGLYKCMSELTKRFPNILFEGCASGGNRFDLGILCYFPQIWASDDTDPICRTDIQNGYSYGYPMSVVTAHVSSAPNHQTLRNTPLETRFNVAAFGICGYECNFCDMKKEDLDAVALQIKLYKEWREVLQNGDFYRGRSFKDGNITEWTCVSSDKEKAVGMIVQNLVKPNTVFEYYKAMGLDSDKRYHFYNRELKYNVKLFGDLVNIVSPIHIKQDSVMHDMVAKFVKMDGEKEDYYLYGDTLMNAGVKLKQNYSGTGYSEEVRYFQDFASRIYFMETE